MNYKYFTAASRETGDGQHFFSDLYHAASWQAPLRSRRSLLRWCRLFLCLFVCLLYALPASASGPESLWVRNSDGQNVFRLDFFGKGLPYDHKTDPSVVAVSAGDFSPAVLRDFVRGVDYWTTILKSYGTPANPVVIRVGMSADTSYNAGAFYYSNPHDDNAGALWSSLCGDGSALISFGIPNDPLVGAHSLISINNYVWDTQPNSNLPETAATLAPTIAHEVGHALGIVDDSPQFTSFLGVGGTTAKNYEDRAKYNPNNPGSTHGPLQFYGPTAMAVFGGTVPMAHASDQEASHFGVRNGLMTHAQITNYPMFMEVELASLVDIGYTIDLRNFFGTSLYDDTVIAKDVDISSGFFASKGLDANKKWLGYDENQSNTSPFGIGVHIYGSNYNVSIQKELLADGAGGAGVRVDGFDNTVTIAKGVAVTGNGIQGTGLLVAFGSGHNIVSRGDIVATGSLGIGARFDFGAPYVEEQLHSYGAYNLNEGDVGQPKQALINGPLVESFDLSGVLAGGASSPHGQYLSNEFVNYEGRPIALYIGPGAHVKAVNVLNGAFIHGDIISRWDPNNFSLLGSPSDYMTDLTFGLEADTEGNAKPNSPDENFRLRYRGNILGPESIKVALKGGDLNYAGVMRVYSFSMDDKTRLLTEFNNGHPSIIEAGNDVTLTTGSGIGFAPSSFSYGRQLAQGGNALLRFTKSAPTDPELLPSAGNFSMGAFDYQWNGLYWDADKDAVMVNTTRAAFNDVRGGTDARNAQLALAVRTPGQDAVNARMVRRFGNSGSQGTALSLLGAPMANTGAFWSQGQPFAENTGLISAPVKSKAPSSASSFNWLALGDGGWETGTPRSGVWVAPAYNYLSHQGDSSYTVRGASVTFGFDHFFTEKLYMGLALSLDYPQYESDNAKVNGSGGTGIFYGGLLLPLDVEVGFNGSYGGMFFKQERTVYESQYHSDYNARTLNVGASIGRRFAPAENFALRPFADWNYFYSESSSYAERADIYGLQQESAHNAIYRVQAGLEGTWAAEDMHLGLKAYWSGLRGDTGGTSSSSFVLDPESNRFTAPVDGLDRDSLGLGINTGIRLGGDTELRLEYSLLTGKTTTSHQGMVGLRYNF